MSEPGLPDLVYEYFRTHNHHYRVKGDVIYCICPGIGSVGFVGPTGAFAWWFGDACIPADPLFFEKLERNIAISHEKMVERQRTYASEKVFPLIRPPEAY